MGEMKKNAREGDTLSSPPFFHSERNASGRENCRLFSRGMIFTRARVSLALLSRRKNGGLLVVYVVFVPLYFRPGLNFK